MIEPDSEKIADGVSTGLIRAKVRVTDRRLLIMFLLLVVFVVLSLFWQNHQSDELKRTQHTLQTTQQQLNQEQQEQRAAQQKSETAAKTICEATNASNKNVNTVIGQLAKNVQNSTSLTPAQKAASLTTYAKIHLLVTDCSALVQ